jgi:hypothetical protein
MEATGKGVTEVHIKKASTGGFPEQDIGEVAGESFKSVSVREQYHTCKR